MQVLVLIVQNAVSYEDLGVATSGATFFRSIGASFGVAVFGTIFAGRLGDKLADALAGRPLPPGVSPGALEADPRGIGAACRRRCARRCCTRTPSSITDVFLYAVPVALLAFVLAWFLREDPLRASRHRARRQRDARQQPGRALLARRGVPRRCRVLGTPRGPPRDLPRRSPSGPGYDLLPAASWLLLRIRRYGSVEPARARRAHPRPAARSSPRRPGRSRSAGLAVRDGARHWCSTDEGREVAERLARAREESLAELLGDWWGPDRPDRPGRSWCEELNARAVRLATREQPHDDGAPRPLRRGRRVSRRTADRASGEASLANQCSAYGSSLCGAVSAYPRRAYRARASTRSRAGVEDHPPRAELAAPRPRRPARAARRRPGRASPSHRNTRVSSAVVRVRAAVRPRCPPARRRTARPAAARVGGARSAPGCAAISRSSSSGSVRRPSCSRYQRSLTSV